MKRLDGKRTLVTGAGRGIGAAVARAFAAEGASVILHYGASADRAQRLASELEQQGATVACLGADLEQGEKVRRLADEALGLWGGIDILVNNAAIFNGEAVFDITEDTWNKVLAVNLRAPFLLCQRIGKAMVEGDGGVILNFSSGGGLAPRPGYEIGVAYGSSKAGVIMLTRRLALELAPKVRVNCLVPGMIDSKPGGFSPEIDQFFASRTPLARVGQVDEIASVALFMVSDDARYMTGEVINVDGGLILA